MKKVRYFFISLLLNKKEKSAIVASINNTYYALNNYSNGMGESHREFVDELGKLKRLK